MNLGKNLQNSEVCIASSQNPKRYLQFTVTASKETLHSVIHRKLMETTVLIGLPPDRINIKYIVQPCPSLTELRIPSYV